MKTRVPLHIKYVKVEVFICKFWGVNSVFQPMLPLHLHVSYFVTKKGVRKPNSFFLTNHKTSMTR